MSTVVDTAIFYNGDTFHCWRDSFLSRLIRKETHSKFSHTAMFLRIDGNPYILDAQSDGIHLRPFDRWIEEYNYNFVVTRFASASLDSLQYRKVGMSYLDTKYGYVDLLRHWIYRNTRIWLGIDKEYKKLVCSELRMLIHDNFFNVDERIESMSPGDVYTWEMNNGFVEFYEK